MADEGAATYAVVESEGGDQRARGECTEEGMGSARCPQATLSLEVNTFEVVESQTRFQECGCCGRRCRLLPLVAFGEPRSKEFYQPTVFRFGRNDTFQFLILMT